MMNPTALLAENPIVALSTPPGHATRLQPAPSSRSWATRLSNWLRSTADALDPSARDFRIIDAFADQLSRAREADEVRVALVRLAGQVSGAARVELFRARGSRASLPLASWPDRPTSSAPGRAWAEHPGRAGLAGFRTPRDRPDHPSLWLDLRSGGDVLAILHLTAPDDHPWDARVVRCLVTLCAMAAPAERALTIPGKSDGPGEDDPEGVLAGERALGTLLRFGLAQARRRHEPLSLLTIEVDRFAAIRALLGEVLADEATARVGRVIQDTLRASDVVTRLDGGRLSAILPNAPSEDAMRVAEEIRAAIARAGTATELMPVLTATIGVASYPDHAKDVATLRAASSGSLSEARGEGYDRVACLDPATAAA